MIILGFDLETTGLNFATDRITEVGAVLWDTTTGKPLCIFNKLLHLPDARSLVTSEIVELTGITPEMLESYGEFPPIVIAQLLDLMQRADAVVAHNGTGFDRPMLEAELARHRLLMPEVPWIDTAVDVPYPPRMTTRKLVHLAAEHGFVNPFAHRAVFDVLTMLHVLQHYDVEKVLETARLPNVTLIAEVSYDDREKAKVRGYRWHAETRTWRKTVKANGLEDERNAGFPITVVP